MLNIAEVRTDGAASAEPSPGLSYAESRQRKTKSRRKTKSACLDYAERMKRRMKSNLMCSAATVSGKTPSLMAQKLYSSMLYPVFTDGNPYLCDANGNETRNLSHRVKEASYNTMDLPTLVTFTDGNSLRMRYTSDGRRVETLSKTWLTPLVVPADTLALRDSTLQYAQEAPSASLAASTSSTASTSSSNSGITSGRPATGITGPALYLPYRLHREWRIGDVVLEDSLISRIDIRNGSFRVERDSLGGARLACYRHVTDYLGSVRTVYRMGTSWVLTPVQHITYMPSGAVLANSDGDVQQRMFCGKELQPLHGWKMYDSHARMQYNVLPRFSSTDPLCQKYYHLSPYAYCANDPVNMVDPEGKDGVIVFEGNRIIIKSSIYLFGNGATQDVADQMQKDINETWGGDFLIEHNNYTYNVSYEVTVKLYKNKEKASPLIIWDSLNPFSRNNYIKIDKNCKRSFVDNFSGDTGVWRCLGRNGFDFANDDPSPHELGHLLGLDDQYKDSRSGPIRNAGWENNIMGNSRTGKVEERNAYDILKDVWKEPKFINWERNKRQGVYKYEISLYMYNVYKK